MQLEGLRVHRLQCGVLRLRLRAYRVRDLGSWARRAQRVRGLQGFRLRVSGPAVLGFRVQGVGLRHKELKVCKAQGFRCSVSGRVCAKVFFCFPTFPEVLGSRGGGLKVEGFVARSFRDLRLSI